MERKRSHRIRRPASAAIEIREMELKDLPGVFELGQALFTAEALPTLYRCWDQDAIMKLFGSDGETCLVAENGGGLVGFALGAMMEKPRSAWRYGWLEWLGVMPRYKRRGLASRLLARLTDRFIANDARIMFVDTDEENHDALAFFRKQGFGQEIRHVYLSLNLQNHPEYILRMDAEGALEE